MKKLLSCVLSVLLACCLVGCGTQPSEGDTGKNPPDDGKQENVTPPDDGKQEESIMPYDRYDLAAYVAPVWKSKVVYNETLLFVGKDDASPLLRTATEILSVRSYDLKTEYRSGVDYTFSDNCIRLTQDTDMPYFKEDEYYPVFPVQGQYFDCMLPDHPYILFGEGDTFCKKQVAVTYKTREKWTGFVPESQTQYFPALAQKLAGDGAVKIVFYGDSISTGANSSAFIGAEPHAESWCDMTVSYLKGRYGDRFTAVNTAVGGMDTDWGIANVSSAVTAHAPDLVVVGFGMNDIDLTAEEHGEQMRTLLLKIKEENPQAEILLVSPMLPNKEVGWVYKAQENFEEQLLALGREYSVGVARVTSLHKQVLRNKRYRDMTGNNVNHPNDFLARLYAQTVLKALLGETFEQ